MVPIKKAATSVQNLANEVVPRLYYEEKEQECMAKEEQIQVCLLKTKKKDLKIILLALNCSLLDIECKNKTIRTFITFKRCSYSRFN